MIKKFLIPIALCLLLVLSGSLTAHAQGAAPGMSGVEEVLVQYVHFSDPKTADICGLERESIANALTKALLNNNVPAFSVANAKPPIMGVARIELLPEVSTLVSEGLDCTSWVSLTAQTQSNVRLPPIDVLRNVKIVYWHEGILLPSSQITHSDRVNEYLMKMALQFAQQYHMDQPPQLPKSTVK